MVHGSWLKGAWPGLWGRRGGDGGSTASRKPRIGNQRNRIGNQEIESETAEERIGNQEGTNESETSKTRVGNQASNQKLMENDSETTREPSRKPTNVESESVGPNRKPASGELETRATL